MPTTVLQEGDEITVSCAEGETGHIYEGIIDYVTTEYDLDNLPVINTKIIAECGITFHVL